MRASHTTDLASCIDGAKGGQYANGKGDVMFRALIVALALAIGVGLSVSAQPVNDDVTCQPLGSSLASMLLPGAGQWLNGQSEQARVQFGIGAVNAVLAAFFWGDYGPVAVPAHLIWAGYSAIDAAIICLRAHQLDRAEAIAN